VPRPTFLEIPTPVDADALLPDRGARLPHFVQGCPETHEAALAALRVLVVGSGSVGRRIALHLARQQPAALAIVDRGRFKPESLLTQPIAPDDIGSPKAGNTGLLCKSISPRSAVSVYDGPVEELATLAFADVDLVVLATDNLAAEVEVGQRCLSWRKPLVQASVHGDTLVAQVRFFVNADGEGPCPACAFGAAEWAHLNQETTFSCEGLRAGRAVAVQRSGPPTRSTSFLCSQAADLAMAQIFRHVLRLGAPVADTLLEYCGYTHRTVVAPLRRNPQCPCDHRAWTQLPAPLPLAECTLRDLMSAAGRGQIARASLTVDDDLVFVESATCGVCAAVQPVQRFLPAGAAAGHCAACRGPVYGQPFYSHRSVPVAVAAPVLDQPLAALGAGSAQWTRVDVENQALLFRIQDSQARPNS
jgi:molybdopterin/thiamine biosynthesis adenylyltransferase